MTNAVTVAAPPQRVWPWIPQIGRGRAGFYTYTWLENVIGADIHNLDRIDPALQNLAVGDRIWLTPERYLGRVPGQAWRVLGWAWRSFWSRPTLSSACRVPPFAIISVWTFP